MTHEKITGVQYLRGIAVSAVALDHSSSFAGHPFPRLEWGAIGVDLFFLISGFIIAVVSLSGPELAPKVSVRDFLTRRFIRIVPLMWIAVVAFAIFSMAGIRPWPPASFLTGFVLWPFGPIAPGILWTLRLEAVFYVVFAVSMLAGRRWRFLLVLWAVSPIIVWLTHRGTGFPWRLALNPANWEFAAGLVAAFVWLRFSQARRIKMPINPLFVLMLMSGIVIWGIAPTLRIGPGLRLALLFLPVLLVAIHAECPPGRVRAFGELLGNASYSIYLFHVLGVSAALRVSSALFPTASAWLVVVSAALAGTALGIAMHLAVERPLLAALKRRFAAPAAPPESI